MTAREPESWRTAVWRAVRIVVWVFALAIVATVGVFVWIDWQSSGGGLDKRFVVNGALCVAIGAALIGGAIAYRRHRRRVWPDDRASWRTWVLFAPLAVGLVVLALAWLASNLRGAFPS